MTSNENGALEDGNVATTDASAAHERETETRRVVAHGLWYVLPPAVSAVIPLITLPLLTRALSPAEYGAWALSAAFGVFASGLASPGLLSAYERGFFSAPDEQSRARLLHSVVAFTTISLAVVGLAVWWFRGTIALNLLGSVSYVSLLMLGYTQCSVSIVKGFYLLYYRGMGEAKAYAVYTIDETLLGALVSLWLVVGLRMGPAGLALGQLLAGSVVLLLVLRRTSRRLRPDFAWAPIREAVHVGYPLMPRVFVGTLSNQIDKYVVGILQNVASVGTYSIGQRIAYLPFTISTALENIFVPAVYSKLFEGGPAAGREIGRYLTPFAYVTVAVATVVTLFSEEIVTLLAPRSYQEAAPIASVLATAYAIMFFGKLPQLVYAKKTWIASLLSILTLGLNFFFCMYAVRRWGPLGAAYGLLATSVVAGVIGFAVRQHFVPIVWEYRRLGGAYGLLVLAMLTTSTLQEAGVPYAWRFGGKVAFLLVLLWLGAAVGVLTGSRMRTVLSMLQKGAGRATA